jgi:hypothetical protein
MLLVNLLTHPVFFPAQSQSTHILVSWRLVPLLFALRKFLSGLCGNDAPDLTLENYFVISALVDAAHQFSIGTALSSVDSIYHSGKNKVILCAGAQAIVFSRGSKS